jgi:inosine-uridine nucleoside N-ribohydrolase
MVSAQGFVAPLGSSEWDDLGTRLERRHAVDFLIETIRDAAEPPVVAAIGPLTNVAAALRRAPEIARRVRALVLMGGRLGPEAHRGEHNFNSDAEATAVVLGCGAPLQIGTYEVTCQAKIGEAELPRLRAAAPACSAAASQLAHYLQVTKRTATSMYDPLSLTLAYTDRFLTTRPVALRWQTGERLVTLSTAEQGTPNAAVSVDLDAPAFVEHLLTALGA